MEARQGPFKIWKNPTGDGDPLRFMGEAYAPLGQLCLRAIDLLNLGFPSGCYTILGPESLTFLYDMPKWQRLEVCP
jgi:hypothetical protein